MLFQRSEDEASPQGHSMSDALRILHDEILNEVKNTNQTLNRNFREASFREKFRKHFLHHDNAHSAFHWTTCVAVLVSSVMLVVASAFQIHRYIMMCLIQFNNHINFFTQFLRPKQPFS